MKILITPCNFRQMNKAIAANSRWITAVRLENISLLDLEMFVRAMRKNTYVQYATVSVYGAHLAQIDLYHLDIHRWCRDITIICANNRKAKCGVASLVDIALVNAARSINREELPKLKAGDLPIELQAEVESLIKIVKFKI